MSNKKFSWNRPFPKWLTALSFVLLSLILVGTGSTVFPQVVEASEAVLPVQQEDDETPDAGEGEEEEIDEFINIVVARVPIAIGTRIEPEFIMLEPRLVTNTAIRGNYTITSFSDVVGRIVKTDLSEGQEILEPMLALSATDLPEIGSDLSLHVDNGQVAIAFPINRYSGMANAMRPGDRIDVLMTFNLIELDVEFQTPLPNITRLVDQEALERGEPFLFPAISQGRQELIPQIGRVVEVIPKGVDVAVGDGTLSVSEPEQIPRRATQLTIQQAEVLWIGNWNDPRQSGWQGPNNYSLLPTIQRINILIEELSDVPSAIEVRESGELELINVRRVQLESLLSELNDLTLQEQEQILVDYGIEAQSL
ncbi:MAG: SAF domain-containing protein, partial [Chloroflexota bacterium]